MSSDRERPVWEQGWSGHARQQLQRLSRLPLPDKLQWLEEAHRLVLHLTRGAPTPAAPAGDKRRVTTSG